MKKTIVTVLSFLFFVGAKAQVAQFLSLQSATSFKDAKGNFVEAREWIGQQMHLSFDLSRKKLQFFSKGLLDTDSFSLKKEILILNKRPSLGMGGDKVFSAVDESGRHCIVRLTITSDEFKTQRGELRLEYLDRAEIYKIQPARPNPVFNKTKL